VRSSYGAARGIRANGWKSLKVHPTSPIAREFARGTRGAATKRNIFRVFQIGGRVRSASRPEDQLNVAVLQQPGEARRSYAAEGEASRAPFESRRDVATGTWITAQQGEHRSRQVRASLELEAHRWAPSS